MASLLSVENWLEWSEVKGGQTAQISVDNLIHQADSQLNQDC